MYLICALLPRASVQFSGLGEGMYLVHLYEFDLKFVGRMKVVIVW
jgi:hypothetical protein